MKKCAYKPTRFEMKESPKDTENHETIEESLQWLAAHGFIYDTGQRRWSDRTQSYQVVWAAIPPKHEQS